MNLKSLRYFVTLAEILHFGRAAARLNIAQPALSMQIRALEEEFGGPLFIRSQRRVSLTPAGAAVYRDACDLLNQATRLEQKARQLCSGKAGTLNLKYTGNSAYSGLLRDIVHTLRNETPDISLQLEELNPTGLLRTLPQSQDTLAILPSLGVEIPTGFKTLILEKTSIWLALPDAHPQALLSSVDLSRLEGETFITYSGNHSDPAQLVCQIAGFRPRQTLEATNLMTLLSYVGGGMGVALLPASVQQAATPFGVKLLPLKGRQISMNMQLLYRKSPGPLISTAIRAIKSASGSGHRTDPLS